MRKSFVLAGIVCLFSFLILSPPTRAIAAGEIEFKFANYFPPPSAHSKMCEEFIKELEEQTGGKVKVRYFAGGSMLTAPAMIKGIESGIADMGLSHIEYTPGRMPVMEACDLPLGIASGWTANQLVNDFYNKFKPKDWDKVKVLWMHASTPSVLITKKPVRTMEDLKGMTIRAPGRLAEVIQALGGTPAPTPVVETYDAMVKGVLDGVLISLETLKTFRFGEVGKYVTYCWNIGPIYTMYVVMNKNSYKKLTPDVKEVFDRLCGKHGEKFALGWNDIDFAGEDFAKERGLEFIDLSPEEQARWSKACQPVIENYVKSMVSAGHKEAEVREWIKYLNERSEYWTKKQIQYHIKSATGPKEMRGK
ncbi:MAG: C4-dicarboxylate ABC transporter substrate-binding protein [Deltaproteobacteria bacterium HGW-Deltaproteobacteria-15]|jgi:TRAP-type C4-dicarboxylate transport system substrate-binding protein|nr:MAG: C4-dicarboxylate ABC transporter substrate-binding protein [Deltaproteobacteria bacterium HGW-Deltaproteobacteria-15]